MTLANCKRLLAHYESLGTPHGDVLAADMRAHIAARDADNYAAARSAAAAPAKKPSKK